MKDWKPQAKPLPPQDQSRLSVEEILVLACADGKTRVEDIPYATGMPPEVVREIVERLEARGALAGEAHAPPARAAATFEVPSIDELLPIDERSPADPPLPAEEPEPAADPRPMVGSSAADVPPSLEELDARIDEGLASAPEDAGAPADEEQEEGKPDPTAVAEDASLQEKSATYRQLYESRLSHLNRDERLSRVGGAVEPELSAFCFDPEPPVIHRLFENAHAGLSHARLVAAHHRTSSGLEALTKHQTLLHDGQVQRLLLRNTMVPQSLFHRILQPKRLTEVHQTMLSRDIPERSRIWARNLLRQKWPTSSSEERVELIWKTEGRVLPILVGLNLDSKATALLCKRQFASVVFVRNLAAWSATPPPLIAHLLKQPLVKRIPQLRNMLLRHPNVTSEAKRKG